MCTDFAAPFWGRCRRSRRRGLCGKAGVERKSGRRYKAPIGFSLRSKPLPPKGGSDKASGETPSPPLQRGRRDYMCTDFAAPFWGRCRRSRRRGLCGKAGVERKSGRRYKAPIGFSLRSKPLPPKGGSDEVTCITSSPPTDGVTGVAFSRPLPSAMSSLYKRPRLFPPWRA